MGRLNRIFIIFIDGEALGGGIHEESKPAKQKALNGLMSQATRAFFVPREGMP